MTRLRDERGFTIVELLVAMVVTGIVMTALVNIFISGTRTAADTTARTTAQQNVRLAFDRLEFEARCATSATIVGSGSGVALALPAQCVHGTGTVCWGVAAGTLSRYANSTCTGSGMPFVRDLTSATPFSLTTAAGYLPRLEAQLTVDTTNRASDALTLADTITLRNAPRS
jgi:prepilin-type N-terminal cleavage/methylation domain-containing protein